MTNGVASTEKPAPCATACCRNTGARHAAAVVRSVCWLVRGKLPRFEIASFKLSSFCKIRILSQKVTLGALSSMLARQESSLWNSAHQKEQLTCLASSTSAPAEMQIQTGSHFIGGRLNVPLFSCRSLRLTLQRDRRSRSFPPRNVAQTLNVFPRWVGRIPHISHHKPIVQCNDTSG